MVGNCTQSIEDIADIVRTVLQYAHALLKSLEENSKLINLFVYKHCINGLICLAVTIALAITYYLLPDTRTKSDLSRIMMFTEVRKFTNLLG